MIFDLIFNIIRFVLNLTLTVVKFSLTLAFHVTKLALSIAFLPIVILFGNPFKRKNIKFNKFFHSKFSNINKNVKDKINRKEEILKQKLKQNGFLEDNDEIEEAEIIENDLRENEVSEKNENKSNEKNSDSKYFIDDIIEKFQQYYSKNNKIDMYLVQISKLNNLFFEHILKNLSRTEILYSKSVNFLDELNSMIDYKIKKIIKNLSLIESLEINPDSKNEINRLKSENEKLFLELNENVNIFSQLISSFDVDKKEYKDKQIFLNKNIESLEKIFEKI